MTSIQHAEFYNWPEFKRLIEAFAVGGQDIRVVGGAVRDALMDRPVVDVDFCTPAEPVAVVEVLEHAHIRAIPTGIEHGTITALIGRRTFEITTLRRDVACDGRHAEVEFSEDYEEDARRRDFTINALSADASGQVFDYHQGLEDMNARKLRFIGQAEDRIIEDALRLLRLFRFQAELGFAVDASALQAAEKLKAELAPISRERIRVEWFKLLASSNPEPALLHMQSMALLEQIFEMEISVVIAPLLAAETSLGLRPDALVRFASMLPAMGSARELAARLKQTLALSNQDEKRLAMLLTHKHAIAYSIPEVERKKLQRQLDTEGFLQALLLNAAAVPGKITNYQTLAEAARAWEIPVFPVTGKDLLEQGIEEGKVLGDTLKRLEVMWESDDYRPDKATLLRQL